MEMVNHPSHYGGGENVYEVIKIIEHYKLNFCKGNVLKYLLRAGKKYDEKEIEDLEKALWYLQRELDTIKKERETSFTGIQGLDVINLTGEYGYTPGAVGASDCIFATGGSDVITLNHPQHGDTIISLDSYGAAAQTFTFENQDGSNTSITITT